MAGIWQPNYGFQWTLNRTLFPGYLNTYLTADVTFSA